jgi:hypothetical protein
MEAAMAKKVAVGGICTALCVLCLYFASVIKTNTLFFLGLSSLFIAVSLLECGIPAAVTVYAASSFLGFFAITDKLIVLPYVMLAGIYPVVKALIERINILWAEWVLKFVFLGASLFLISKFYFPRVSIPLYWALAAAFAVFAVYDLALSYGITYYKKRFKNVGKNS